MQELQTMPVTRQLRRLCAFIALLWNVGGCATLVRIDAVPTTSQQQVFRDGVPILISQKSVTVIVSPKSAIRPQSEHLQFAVSVENTSGNQFDFDTTNVVSRVDGMPLRIRKFEEIVNEIKTTQALKGAFIALGGSLQAVSAQQQASFSSSFATSNENTNGKLYPLGAFPSESATYSANTVGTYSQSTYNPAAGLAAAAAVNAETEAQMANLRARSNSALIEASQTVIKRTTVLPGTSYGGLIVLAGFDRARNGSRSSGPKSGSTLDLIVTVAGEEHEFHFLQESVTASGDAQDVSHSLGSRGKQNKYYDQKFANDVSNALSEAKLRGYDIGIEVTNGTAKLTGEVVDSGQRELASNVAAKVRGIRKIDNRLIVTPFKARTVKDDPMQETPPKSANAVPLIDNQQTTEEITSALRNAGLIGFDLEVGFQDGVATIAGAVANPEQRATITQVVAAIDGVASVPNEVKLLRNASKDLTHVAAQKSADVSHQWKPATSVE